MLCMNRDWIAYAFPWTVGDRSAAGTGIRLLQDLLQGIPTPPVVSMIAEDVPALSLEAVSGVGDLFENLQHLAVADQGQAVQYLHISAGCRCDGAELSLDASTRWLSW